jgi:hypothetical protein
MFQKALFVLLNWPQFFVSQVGYTWYLARW